MQSLQFTIGIGADSTDAMRAYLRRIMIPATVQALGIKGISDVLCWVEGAWSSCIKNRVMRT